MMNFIPQKNAKGKITAAAVFASSFVVSSIGGVFPAYGGIINVAAALVMSFALWITVRFALSSYVYEIKDGSLNIGKIVGSRRSEAASLNLTTCVAIYKKPKNAEESRELSKKIGKTDRRMNFCTNIFADAYVYVTEFNGKIYEIYLEIDGAFAAEIERNAAVAKECAKSSEYGE